jgi:uncharacterized membrane protein YtjA (UPF0391 family)
MLVYSLGFLAIALTAALLGFRGIASGAAGIACLSLVAFLFASITLICLQLATSKRTTPLF